MTASEKITINLSVVDLGKIDLMTEEGFYTNRTDFIRTGIKQLLLQHENETNQAVSRMKAADELRSSGDIGTKHAFAVGVMAFSASDLKHVLADNKRISINIICLLRLNNDVTPKLANQAIKSIKVRGAFRGPADVKKILADRTL